ncbi:solute carrier family 12 member 8-like isoform X2 [Lineus longissimus]|uniref:solute carrier family 12 member 8-like isoform X2 n=1 Tax=Lineus longissimus TaxID=88925 RepID=UPI00315CF240
MADDDSESRGLMGKGRQEPDWSRFGLSRQQQKETESAAAPKDYHDDHSGYQEGEENVNELYSQDKSYTSKPWYQSNFFIREPVLFGTWDGVFTSCMINIFGVVIFLRTGWMVGLAGIPLAILIILMTIFVALISVLSAIGVCERCKMESGGVYFLLSHVLGARIGTTVGVLYCFGQAVACSLYVMGFGESISALMHQNNEWISRGIAVGVVMLLLGINVAGVKWVIRLQLVLLVILAVAVLDFVTGSFVHTEVELGVTGYSLENLQNNTAPSYTKGESFFTVFGVFFPTATGVFAGINMSGDLDAPHKSIPVGTLSAVGVSTFLYLAFAVVLGATCERVNLQTDYMITEKVAVFGALWLAGLYVSSLSAALGQLTGSPRVLQALGKSHVIKQLNILGEGRGANKVPIFALLVITLISLLFIFIGEVNTLGPIVTMPFMLTYAAVNYAYFSLAMSFDHQKQRDARYSQNGYSSLDRSGSESKLVQNGGNLTYGAVNADTKDKNDLDKLFPERVNPHTPRVPVRHESVESDQGEATFDKTASQESKLEEGADTQQLIGEGTKPEGAEVNKKPVNVEILRQPRSCYSIFCNRWLSLVGVVACVIIMFAIQWIYALINVAVAIIIYIYIGQTNPGVFPGIADFNLYLWVKNGIQNCCRRGPPPPEQIVVTRNTPAMETMAAQLTEDNEDFAERGRYHQSEVVKGENFDDYQD